MMHWSKSRQVDYESCPRRFFYSEIAAPRNPKIAELSRRFAPPLARHEIVRKLASEIVGVDARKWSPENHPHLLEAAKHSLSSMIEDEFEAKAQFSIAKTCLDTFVAELLPELCDCQILLANSKPVEFMYDGLSIYALPEVVVDRGESIEILIWRTGSSGFTDENERYLRAGGLTCWARSVLGEFKRTISVSEIYLREPNPVTRLTSHLDDNEVRIFVEQARNIVKRYSATAKIAEFPAQPGYSACRFCNFSVICPEYESYSENSFEVEALKSSISSAAREKEEALTEVGGEVRPVFLSHVSEDKETVVRPFARALESEGIPYWLDEAELEWGDSLTKEMNRGLAISDYVICFFSNKFVERGWPQAELGAAIAAQMSDGNKRLLPIMISEPEFILKAYPMLSDLKFMNWSDGIEKIVKELKRVIKF